MNFYVWVYRECDPISDIVAFGFVLLCYPAPFGFKGVLLEMVLLNVRCILKTSPSFISLPQRVLISQQVNH